MTVSEQSESGDNIVMFLIPLAKTLALAESKEGRPLTEDEVLKIRDNAPCISLSREKAAKFEQDRNYKDLDANNVWMEWHRVKVEDFDASDLPAAYLTICAMNDKLPALERVFEEYKALYKVLPPNPEIVATLENARSKQSPPIQGKHREELLRYEALIDASTASFKAANATKASYENLQLIAKLIMAGALEIFCGSSYLGHDNKVWLGLAQSVLECVADGTKKNDFYRSLISAFVQFPIRIDDQLFTCGMHLLGKPDLIIDSKVIVEQWKTNDGLEGIARQLFWTLSVYLLAICPEGEFVSGNTFSLAEDSPTLRAVWEPCTLFKANDVRFNYLGYWRLSAP